MTEQIKSAIHCMRANQGIGFCEECPAYAKVGKGHCVRESCRIAENSLKAWEEVLQELEHDKEICFAHDSDEGFVYARVIDFINQKLAEIEE